MRRLVPMAERCLAGFVVAGRRIDRLYELNHKANNGQDGKSDP